MDRDIPKEILTFPGLVMLAYRGSVAHGTYIPPGDPFTTDDIDLIGVYVAHIEHYLGFKNAKTVEINVGSYDFVGYEFRHFVGLLCKNNPNLMSALYLNPEHYIKKDWQFNALIASRHLFSSKRIYHCVKGYAMSQIKRMLKPPTEQAYQGDRRRRLYEKFGYDVKQAAHALRLLRMGTEFLKTGYMFVDRKPLDAQDLIAIKQGEWTLSRVQEQLKAALRRLREERDATALREDPDVGGIEKLLIKTLVVSLKINWFSYLGHQDVEEFYTEK